MFDTHDSKVGKMFAFTDHVRNLFQRFLEPNTSNDFFNNIKSSVPTRSKFFI